MDAARRLIKASIQPFAFKRIDLLRKRMRLLNVRVTLPSSAFNVVLYKTNNFRDLKAINSMYKCVTFKTLKAS